MPGWVLLCVGAVLLFAVTSECLVCRGPIWRRRDKRCQRCKEAGLTQRSPLP